MYNCMNHHTGSAVARVTNDRAARPHLLSTVENQLGRRRRQLLAIIQWNVRTLLDPEATDRPERRTTLVAVEPAKYNIDIAAICETRFSEFGSFNDLEYSATGKPKEKERRLEWLCYQNDTVTKLTELIQSGNNVHNGNLLISAIYIFRPQTTFVEMVSTCPYNKLNLSLIFFSQAVPLCLAITWLAGDCDVYRHCRRRLVSLGVHHSGKKQPCSGRR